MRMRPWFTAALLLAAACSDANAPPNTVQVLDNQFSPRTLTVARGSLVYWVWSGAAAHDVVFDEAAGGPNSPVQVSGQFERDFPNPGTFSYVCTLHAGMTGSIVVQ